mmetsp:Transcript_40587/g.48700  ORF Transcript_40587/g.48700 Transcript_40587/m.48700 type:complete len:113 (-) Transcript_40587:832-1170(-)
MVDDISVTACVTFSFCVQSLCVAPHNSLYFAVPSDLLTSSNSYRRNNDKPSILGPTEMVNQVFVRNIIVFFTMFLVHCHNNAILPRCVITNGQCIVKNFHWVQMVQTQWLRF